MIATPKVWAFLLVLVLLHTVRADDKTKEDEKDREHQQVTKRKLEINVNDYEVEIEGSVQDGKVRDKVEFGMVTKEDDGLRLTFEHKSKDEAGAQSNIKIWVQFQELFEYRVTGGDLQEFRPNSTDFEVLRRWVFGKNEWGKFVATKTSDGVHSFTTTAGNGVLVVRGHIAEQDVATGGVSLNPNTVKVDLEIHGWSYSSLYTDSRLALRAVLKSVNNDKRDEDREGEPKDGRIKFEVASGSPGGRFRWVEEVTITGNLTAPVKAVVAPGRGDSDFRSWNTVFFSFLTPDGNTQVADIVWDPDVGLDYSTLSGISTVVVVVLSVAGAAVVAGIVGFVIYRRRSAAAAEKTALLP